VREIIIKGDDPRKLIVSVSDLLQLVSLYQDRFPLHQAVNLFQVIAGVNFTKSLSYGIKSQNIFCLVTYLSSKHLSEGFVCQHFNKLNRYNATNNIASITSYQVQG